MRLVFSLLLACAGLAAPALAVTKPATTTLSPEQAAELALQHSLELRAQQLQLVEDRAQVDQAVRLNNPSLRVDMESSELWYPAVQGQLYQEPLTDMAIDLRWAPPNLGSWGARQARAERRVDQTQASIEDSRRKLVARVLTLHAQVRSLDAQLQLAATATELRDQLRQLTARRLEAQAATGLDETLAALDYLDAVTERAELASERAETVHNLLFLLGLPEDTELQLVAGPATQCDPPEGELEAQVQHAQQLSSLLALHAARIAEVEAELARAYLEIIPWFNFVQVGYVMGEGNTRFTLGGDKDYAALRVRFGVDLPLLDWNQSEIDTLRARKARFEADQEADVRRLERRVRRTVQELSSRHSLFQHYLSSDSGVVEESLSLIRRALELGESDLMQMALVQSRTLRARRGRLRAELRCQETAIELSELLGTLPVSVHEGPAALAPSRTSLDGAPLPGPASPRGRRESVGAPIAGELIRRERLHLPLVSAATQPGPGAATQPQLTSSP